MQKGVNDLCAAVASTLGPTGKTVIIKNSNYEDEHITKDGVTVANSMDSDDPLQNLGMQIAKKVSSKTDIDNGDGTTGATVMMNAMINQGFQDEYADVVKYKAGMEQAVQDILAKIDENAIQITYEDKSKIIEVATISSNNDAELGKQIAEAVILAGEYGHVNVIESIALASRIERIEGFVIDLGFADQQFALNKETGYFEADKAKLLLMKDKLIDKSEWLKIVRDRDQFYNGVPLIIIAQDYSQDILRMAAHVNSITGASKVCLLRNNLRENEFESIYEDLAAYSGAQIVRSYEYHDTFGNVNDVIVKPGYTVFGESDYTMTDYLEALKKRIDNEKSPAIRTSIASRIGRFENGVTSFFVGGNSEVEMKERRDRVNDSVNSSKAAITEGIIIGGGQLLLKIADLLLLPYNKQKDFDKGYNNVVKSMLSVTEQIIDNCGFVDDKEEYVSRIVSSNDLAYGFDFKNREWGNLFELGVVDPARTIKNSIRNAASVASTILTTECVIIESNQ